MANAVRTCARRGAASGSASLFASPVNAEVFCRAMSTSSVAKASGSRLGRHSVQVRRCAHRVLIRVGRGPPQLLGFLDTVKGSLSIIINNPSSLSWKKSRECLEIVVELTMLPGCMTRHTHHQWIVNTPPVGAMHAWCISGIVAGERRHSSGQFCSFWRTAAVLGACLLQAGFGVGAIYPVVAAARCTVGNLCVQC